MNFGWPTREVNLSDDEIRDIKMMLIYSGLTQQEIATYHHTSQATISGIKYGDIYSHIDLP